MTDSSRSQPEPRQGDQGYIVAIDAFQFSGGLTFSSLWSRLWTRKLVISAITFIAAIALTAVSYMLQPRYEATVVVVWAGDDNGNGILGSLGGSLGGLAAASGLLPSAESGQSEALAILKSRAFTEGFIRSQELLPTLFREQWDPENGTWKSHVADDPPDYWDAFELFNNKVRSVTERTRDGLIEISVIWTSPDIAATWANELVRMANREIRERRIQQTEASLEFLRAALDRQENIDIRTSIYGLMESQLHTRMMAEVRPDYAFRVVDPAVAPDLQAEVFPKRILFLLGGAMLGLFLSGGWALWRGAE